MHGGRAGLAAAFVGGRFSRGAIAPLGRAVEQLRSLGGSSGARHAASVAGSRPAGASGVRHAVGMSWTQDRHGRPARGERRCGHQPPARVGMRRLPTSSPTAQPRQTSSAAPTACTDDRVRTLDIIATLVHTRRSDGVSP